MPGLVGLVNLHNVQSAVGSLSAMIASCAYAEKYQKEIFADVVNGLAFARLHLGVFDHGIQPVYSKDKRLVIIFDGELYGNASGKSDPEFVLERYQRLQDACVKGIDGIYAFVILDYNQKVLKIFSDPFGQKPIYYYQSLTQFVFASEVKAILPLHEGPKRRDNKTVADFFAFGFPIGDETLFEDIKLLSAASCLTYDLTSHELSIQRYWHLVDLFTPKGHHNEKIDYQDVVDAFSHAVNRRLSHSEQLGLSLSGGLDSRSILAAMGDRAKGLKTYTVGLKNCRDQVLAKKMSEAKNYQIVQGWFADTLTRFRPQEPIALLRLDADWYDSTFECLNRLFPYVAKGGLIIIDDYYVWDGCSKAVHDYLSVNKLSAKVYQRKNVCFLVK